MNLLKIFIYEELKILEFTTRPETCASVCLFWKNLNWRNLVCTLLWLALLPASIACFTDLDKLNLIELGNGESVLDNLDKFLLLTKPPQKRINELSLLMHFWPSLKIAI